MRITILILVTLLISCHNQFKGKKDNSDTIISLNKNNADSIYAQKNSYDTISLTKSPSIDGIINIFEWTKSKRFKLAAGDSLFFLKSNDTLFIAIRGNSGGFTSMGFSNKKQLLILHASTGLITAEYAKNNNSWQLVHDFKEPIKQSGNKYPRNHERLSMDYRKSHLEQFGWYANLIEMGNPSETEFFIPLATLPKGKIYFSVVFYQIKSKVKKAKYPNELNDDMLNQELIAGSAKSVLNFDVDTWIPLSEILK